MTLAITKHHPRDAQVFSLKWDVSTPRVLPR
jgi:hypothetical protein